MAIEFKELFFSDPRVQVDPQTGYIWKPVLRAGEWKVGPNGKPLVVIAGRSLDQTKAIGLQDIVDNFKRGVIEHVTIPLSHDDRVDENTGYIRDVKVHTAGNEALLMAAHDFTEPDVKGKVQRGTIPNTSVGLEFGYTAKESGVRHPIVLKHVALTHRPWINKLAPFGVNASEVREGDYDVETAQFSEVLPLEKVAHFSISAWDTDGDIERIREKIKGKLPEGFEPEVMARDSVLVKDRDGRQFVVNYSLADGDVSIAEQDAWVEHTVAPPSSTTPPASAPDATITPINEPPKEPTVVTPPVQPTDTEKALQEQLAAAQVELTAAKTQLSEQGQTISTLAMKDRVNETETFLTLLRKMGLTEDAGATDLLVYLRNLRLSDQGQATVLLSEAADQQPKPITVTTMLDEIFKKLPTDERTGALKVVLSEQVTPDPLDLSSSTKPVLLDESGRPIVEGTDEWERHQEALFSQLTGAGLAL